MIRMHVKTVNNMPLVNAAVKEMTAHQLKMVGIFIQREAKVSMKAGGRIQVGKKSMMGIPSTPPDPPHVQTGNLRASINVALEKRGRGQSIVVGPTYQAWYGHIHELGVGLYPIRAFMIPALVKAIAALPGIFKKVDLSMTTAGKAANMKGLYKSYGRTAP